MGNLGRIGLWCVVGDLVYSHFFLSFTTLFQATAHAQGTVNGSRGTVTCP